MNNDVFSFKCFRIELYKRIIEFIILLSELRPLVLQSFIIEFILFIILEK